MNLKITFTVLATLLISLSTSYLIMGYSIPPDCNDEQNQLNFKINPNKKSVIIMGSSQVGVLNENYINEQVSQINPDHEVYLSNLPSDVPVRRLQLINQIVCAEPELVVYGIAFRDFSKFATGNQKFLPFGAQDRPEPVLPDPQSYFQRWFYQPFDSNINPKLFTLEFFKDAAENFGKQPTVEPSKRPTFDFEYPDELDLAGESNLILNLRADNSLIDFSKSNSNVNILRGKPNFIEGPINGALSFDGKTVIQIEEDIHSTNSTNNFDSTDPFSIAFWIKMEHQNQQRMAIISKADVLEQQGFSVYINSDGFPILSISNTEKTNELRVKYDLEDIRDGKWRNFVWTYDGSMDTKGISLYVDGLSVNLDSFINNLDSSTQNDNKITIGAQGNFGKRLHADLDDIRIYNDELTPSEAMNLYEMKDLSNIRKLNHFNSDLEKLTIIYQAFAEEIALPQDNETGNELRFQESYSPEELKNLRVNIVKNAKNFAKVDPYTLEKNSDAIRKIIEILQDNDIKIVLFTVPHSDVILEQVSESDYDLFNSTLANISNEQQVAVRPLLEKYSSMSLWADTYHVTRSESGLIYSDDVAKIILEELK